jgi:hypothetical protein
VAVSSGDMASLPDRSARPPRRGRARSPRSQLGVKMKPAVQVARALGTGPDHFTRRHRIIERGTAKQGNT